MAANERLDQLSTTDASNTPAGSDVIGSSLSYELRSIKANIARSAREESTATASAAATLAVTVLNKIVPVSGSAGGSTTITLPAAATAGAGFRFTAWKTDNTNNVVIDANGAETINGSANYTLSSQYEAAEFVTDGTSWIVKDTGFIKTSGGSMTGDLTFGDNDKAIFGAGSDLQIYHDGSNSYVKDAGIGYLILGGQSTGTAIHNGSGQNLLITGASDINLAYAGNNKLATTSGGINVTGTVTSDGADLDGAVVINESSADVDFRVESNGNENMLFVDGGNNRVGIKTSTPGEALHIDAGASSSIRLGETGRDYAYRLRANVSDSVNGGFLIEDAESGNDLYKVVSGASGNHKFYINGTAAERAHFGPTTIIFNETSDDVDFRVESNGNTHMLFVDGGNDNVHIGSSAVTSQSVPLQVGTGQANQIVVKGSGSGFTQGGIIIESGTDNTPGSRGQGVYYFNEGNDRTYYAGTLYNNGTVWGVGSTTGTSLATAAANTTNATFSVDSVNGRVGVGTATPSQKLTVNGSDARIYLTGAGTNIDMDSSANGQLHLDGNGYDFAIALNATAANLYTNSSSRSIIFGTDETERMRVANDGVRIGTTSHIFNSASNEALSVKNASTGNALTLQSTDVTGGFPILYLSSTDSASSQNAVVFQRTGGTVGTITTTASATAYNTSSDYRLKENVTALTGAIDRVKTLSPKRFNFIVEPDKTVDGFLAHEVTTVPEAIVGTKDQVDDDDNPVYQGIDQSKLVPLLTAALQEAVAKIESLETRIAALET